MSSHDQVLSELLLNLNKGVGLFHLYTHNITGQESSEISDTLPERVDIFKLGMANI